MKSSFSRLLCYLQPFKKNYILAIIYSILNKLFDILPEILIGVAIDVVVSRQFSWLASLGIVDIKYQLLTLGLITLIIWLCESLFQYLYSIKWKNLGQQIQHKLRTETCSHVHALDQKTFDELRTGNLLSILNDDINQLERFLENGVNQCIQIIVSTLTIGAIFFCLAPKIALLAITPIPLVILGAFYFQKQLGPRFLKVRDRAGLLANHLNHTITGILTIKSLTAEQHELKKIQQASEEYRVANEEAIRCSSLVTPIIRMAILIGFVATLVYGGFQAVNGLLNVGIYGMLVFLTQRLLWPLTTIAEVTINYQRSMASTQRILDLLQIPLSLKNEGKTSKENLKGDLVFQTVDFAYDFQRPILKDFSINIPAGQNVAFVGTTGSGKSTLVKLLLRLYEPQGGNIFLDGLPLTHFDIYELRKAIGVVSQDIFLFHGTIAENIAYPHQNVDQEKIVEAAKIAQAHEFITRLPQGYQTTIGERGQKLSGGQRQRISIARTIIKNPPILILDEATSAVDNETEMAIQTALDVLIKQRTVIQIAHRLSTIRHADIIHVMKEGMIVESGTHQELLEINTVYASLWKLQTGQRLKQEDPLLRI